ncbi:MAG: hypothetical protein SVX38_01560 [Chloroflexota bacterium]|nr:hypothetical protein [Chloroflexota bacterium]
MGENLLRDMLTPRSDVLNGGKENHKARLIGIPGQQSDSESLMTLAAKVGKALLPVEPSPAFVQGLRRSLVAMSVRKRPRASLPVKRGLLIGAAALGSAMSVVGIIAYVVYVRANAGARTPVHG